MEKHKRQALVDKTLQKIRRKVEILSAPYDAESGWKVILHHIKGEGTISDFEHRKHKL